MKKNKRADLAKIELTENEKKELLIWAKNELLRMEQLRPPTTKGNIIMRLLVDSLRFYIDKKKYIELSEWKINLPQKRRKNN